MSLIIYVSVAVVCALAADGSVDKKNNMWVVHIKGGEEIAKGVARDVGLTNKDEEVLWARKEDVSEKSTYHLYERGDDNFDDTKEQAEINRFIKSIKDTSEFKNCKTGTFACTEVPSRIVAYLKHLGQTSLNSLGTFSTDPASSTTLSTYRGTTKHLNQDSKQLSAYAARFSDPNWRQQWYVQDYRTFDYPLMDHNVVPVYLMDPSLVSEDLAVSTVTVGVLGDGVKAHPDLGDNYVESISYNFCSNQKGSTPNHRTATYGGHEIHDTIGTNSAGVIAMKANNDLCGVGIAPKARIAGLKTTKCESPVPDIEANALKYNLDTIDIYCNAWTIDDYMGRNLVELSSSVESALKLGVSEGREKKGAIYVFPSGINRRHSNCATNGYVNNPYVITIASAASDGKPATYSERCPAVFATAYSGDKYTFTGDITTISPAGGCTTYYPDQPAGPAIAAGIFALVLQHKPDLTYRDMMHLIAMTAEVAPLANNINSWHCNGQGLWVSNDFGFGLLNAKNMINLAKDWKTVPEKHICVLKKTFTEPLSFVFPNRPTVTLDGNECNVGDKKINYLEHVELISSIDYTFRGAVYLNVTSPANTKTEMLEARVKDLNRDNIKEWNIMSVQNWGESAHGTWTITVMARRISFEHNPPGYIREITLKLHGTEEKPAHYNQAREYAAFRSP